MQLSLVGIYFSLYVCREAILVCLYLQNNLKKNPDCKKKKKKKTKHLQHWGDEKDEALLLLEDTELKERVFFLSLLCC